MSETLLKSFKWCVLCLAMIMGTTAFMIASDTGSPKPVMLGVLSYGLVYIMTTFWKEFRGKLLLLSVSIFLALSFAVPYIATAAYILFGYALPPIETLSTIEQFYLWAGTVISLGWPLIFIVFWKYD